MPENLVVRLRIIILFNILAVLLRTEQANRKPVFVFDRHCMKRISQRDIARQLGINELIWNGQISKAFLKSKTLVVALNFYDLLGQQSNYERWVNATSRSDTRYNSINSYAMLHVRYRLNIFGGKVDTEGRYDKKWGNNDRRGR